MRILRGWSRHRQAIVRPMEFNLAFPRPKRTEGRARVNIQWTLC